MLFLLTMQLWFDVEERYNTTQFAMSFRAYWLWFDVEERYNTTRRTEANNTG